MAAVSDADDVVRFLRDLQAAWAQGGEAERAALVASVYDRIVATDQGIIEVELTEDAMRHGLAIALPELVKVVLARPARARRRVAMLVLDAWHSPFVSGDIGHDRARSTTEATS